MIWKSASSLHSLPFFEQTHQYAHISRHIHMHAHTLVHKIFFFISDTKLHSGIKALHRRADTWSFSCCQRGLAIELRCLEEQEEFTPPTFCSSHSYTQAARSPKKWKPITLCDRKCNFYSYFHIQRHTYIKTHNGPCGL